MSNSTERDDRVNKIILYRYPTNNGGWKTVLGPISYKDNAAKENLKTIKDKSGEGVLPAIKVKAPK